MAKTDDEDGEEQPASIMAAKAGRSGQLEFSNRQTASSNLPCTPLVTHKDTRPRFYNPSYLSLHSLICSHTYTHYSIRKPAAEQICTPTHTSAKMIILSCCHRQVEATLSVSSPPPTFKNITLPLHLLQRSPHHHPYSSHTSLLASCHHSSPHISLASFSLLCGASGITTIL